MKRKNKSKKEIVSDIQLVQSAERRRALVKDVIFPYLLEMNDNVGYSKVFIQAFSAIVDGEFNAIRKTTTIGQLDKNISEKLKSMFDLKDPKQKEEYERYSEFLVRLKDISVEDFVYGAELSRYIDGYIFQTHSKDSISTIPIDKILG